MDHYWLDVRYSVHDQIRWVSFIHIIKYVIGTYTNIPLNVCDQVEVSSLTQATTPINVFLSGYGTWYINDDKWVKSI